MKLKMMMIIVAALALGACAKKKATSVRSTRANAINGGLNQTGTSSCSQTSWGRIYSQSIDANSYTQLMAQFTGDTNIGTVDPSYYSTTTGVDLQMSAYFSGNQFNANNSQILIRVIDSNAASLGYIQIPMRGQSGQVLGNGTFQATFADSSGTVTMQGQRVVQNGQQWVYGTLSFQNTNGTSGQLGEFLVAGCALVGI